MNLEQFINSEPLQVEEWNLINVKEQPGMATQNCKVVGGNVMQKEKGDETF